MYKIKYKVPGSARPMWLLRAIVEFQNATTDGDNISALSTKLDEALDKQTYSLGGGSGEYSCRRIVRHVSDDKITILSVTGKREVCEIIFNQ